MKKKIKLISTFASLGLALALMVFGVYAATSVTFNVTTQVTFKETQHVKATVAAAHTAALAGAPTAADYKAVTLTDASAGFEGQNEDDTIGDIAFAAVTLEQGTPVYSYKITITNDDAEDDHKLYVKATWKAVPQDAQFTVVFDGVVKDTEKEIVYGEDPLVITCTVTVTDLAGNSIVADINEYMAMEVELYTEDKPAATPGA